MRLILVRHGQTTSNLGGLLDTAAPGADLTDHGLRQAEALPGALGERAATAVYASTLVRTQQTAAPLARTLGVPVTVRDGLREVHAGALEMLGDAASVHTYLETVFSWGEGDLGRRMPGGEDGHEVFGRYDAVVREIAAGHDVAIAISHGAVIRSWCAARAVNLTPGYAARHALGNTGVIVLQGSPDDGWRAVTWEGSAVDGVARRPETGPAGQPVAHEG